MAYGITDAGFTLKRLSDILSDMNTALSNVTDPDTGVSLTPNLLNENDPLVQIVNAFCASLYDAWEQLEEAYGEFDPLKATGAGLSGLVQLNGLLRKAGRASTLTVALSGTALVTIPAGKRISTNDGRKVFTLPIVTFDAYGSASAIATCTELGPIDVDVGTVVKILTPSTGWVSVTNPGTCVVGAYEETDSALRVRQRDSTAAPAQSMIESIYSALMQVDNVTYVRLFQNISDTVDERDIPPHFIAPVVIGGENYSIATAIFSRLPVGCGTYGFSSVPLTDVQDITYTINFTRPTEVDIYVTVDIAITDLNAFPSDGSDLVIAAIIQYATTGHSDLGKEPYRPGMSVYASDLYLPVLSIPGLQILSITVATTPTPMDSFVLLTWRELAKFSSNNIIVNEISS